MEDLPRRDSRPHACEFAAVPRKKWPSGSFAGGPWLSTEVKCRSQKRSGYGAIQLLPWGSGGIIVFTPGFVALTNAPVRTHARTAGSPRQQMGPVYETWRNVQIPVIRAEQYALQ